MKTIIDSGKVSKRARLANAGSLGGLLLLLAGVVLPLYRANLAQVSSVLMIFGLAGSMISIYYANRWVKRPRPEESLGRALKSLSDSHRLYHYPRLPIDHLLLTPSCVVVFETINLEGKFSYKNGRWREKMGLLRALRWIVEEHLGDPAKSAQAAERFLTRWMQEKIGTERTVPVKSMVVFTHPRVEIDIQGAPVVVCRVEKLRRQLPDKLSRMPQEVYEQLKDLLDSISI